AVGRTLTLSPPPLPPSLGSRRVGNGSTVDNVRFLQQQLDEPPPLIERPADKHDGGMRRRVLDERLEAFLLRIRRFPFTLGNEQTLGVEDNDDAPRRHHGQ